jgi:hypothetical protein
MQEFTVTQWAIVALVFVAGWLLGLASHPGGRKWRERYAAERDAHAGYRKDADARIAAAEARHRELEADHARLTTAPAAQVATPVRPVTTRVVRPGDTTVTGTGERRGWFDFGARR